MSDLPSILTSDHFKLQARTITPEDCPLIPMDDYVIAVRCDSADSLLVPDHLKKPSNQAKVIAVGPGRILNAGGYAPLEVKPGDTIVLGGYLKDGAGVEIAGHRYLIVQAGDIVAKFKA